jgi:hypothetical protein
MTQEHPITPPPELIEDWIEIAKPLPQRPPNPNELAALAARWGADAELEACCEWVSQFNYDDYSYQERLRAARRRPNPPSLKEQAKFAAAVLRSPDETCSIAELQQHWHTICNALESLPD